MCGIVGFVNYKQDISNYKNILINMNNTLSRRGPDEEGYYIQKHVALGHKRLIVIDPEGGKQPMGHRDIWDRVFSVPFYSPEYWYPKCS